jgi:FkbM family methyltransferase
MGWVREKYTKSYFTGLKEDGSRAGYGVEGFSETGNSALREFDVRILQKILLQGRHVLEFGFGRGESIKYCMERGVASYVGVDFAQPAVQLATDFLKLNGIEPPPLHCADALEFLRSPHKVLPHPIDIVIMFDVIEHVPRHELREFFSLLRLVLSEKPAIVINTPAYAFDNDVISDGIDARNHANAIDQADFIEETKGMHCNKFTVPSLQDFMRSVGYTALSEYHVFVPAAPEDITSEIVRPIPSYLQAWTAAHKAGSPIEQSYLDDDIEYAYTISEKPSWNCYRNGVLEGIEVCSTKQYFDSFAQDTIGPVFADELSSGKTVFDVGGFIGLSSLFFSKLVGDTGRVVCFEPNPWNVNRLRLNLSHNSALGERILLYRLGLGAKSGNFPMIVSSNLESGHSSTSQLRAGGHTAIPHQELYEMGFQDITVDVDTLDEFVGRTGIIPDVIKVDIEGSEVDFLRGGLRTLQKHRPSLFIETHNPMAIFFAIEVLREANYSLKALGEEWGNRLQILAKPMEVHGFNDDQSLELQKALHLLFDEHRQMLRRTNDAEFWRNRIAELSGQISKLQSELLALRQQTVHAPPPPPPPPRAGFLDRLGRFVRRQYSKRS